MLTGQPSRTALAAAAMRAAHQTLDGGRIFNDPIAHAVLGPEADAMINAVAADPAQRQMSVFMAARSRFAEDSLDRAVSRGVRQVVILGAGLDTFSLRNPHAGLGLRVFEVDHPATQAWKRDRLGPLPRWISPARTSPGNWQAPAFRPANRRFSSGSGWCHI
jgi:methyltransferase (TIGR00027 family)